MNPYVGLASQAIKLYLENDEVLNSNEAPDALKKKRTGCFVSLHITKDNALRGCIGTILPTCKNLAAEIIGNAISACNDPRFPKLTISEFANLDISVDVLSEPESISSEKLLDPKKYGVIVKSENGHTGLLLPDLEGVDDADYQIAIAREKASILPEEKVFLYRFTVQRYKED